MFISLPLLGRLHHSLSHRSPHEHAAALVSVIQLFYSYTKYGEVIIYIIKFSLQMQHMQKYFLNN